MNAIDRSYQLRGKQVHLQELTDVTAVHLGQAGSSTAGPSAAMEGLVPELAMPQVRAFEDAGWSFQSGRQPTDGAKVYLKPTGRVVLGTNRLVVRFSNDQGRETLARLGLTVIDQPKFASNLFVVTVPHDLDVVEAAERLASSAGVEFAEPDFIEAIPGR